MAQYGKRQRRPPPHPIDPARGWVLMQGRVSVESRDKANRAAAALGISTSAFLAELIERLEVDENGHPGWTSKYASPTDDDANQLPGLGLSA